jgi:signal peptidase I
MAPVEPSTVNIDDIPLSDTDDVIKPLPASRSWSSVKGFFSVIELIGGALLLALAINTFIFQSYQVFGQSMDPTLDEGNRLIINKVSKSWSGVFGGDFVPDRGTIIVFKNPRSDNVQLVKRVLGLPGERVVVKDGAITVFNQENPNGFNPDELFEANLADFTTGNVDITVPEGNIFVSGDNRTPGGSLDSRNDLGTVPVENIVGTLFMRIFPVSEATFF